MKEINITGLNISTSLQESSSTLSFDFVGNEVQSFERSEPTRCPIKPNCKYQTPKGECTAPRCPYVPG